MKLYRSMIIGIRSFLRLASILFLPLVLLCVGLLFLKEKSPYYVHNIDPEYAYLLNSLNMTAGYPPEHIDHPGTPVQLLGAGVLVLAHRYQCPSHCDDLQMSVLANSEFYLYKINQALQLLITISLVLLGYVTYTVTKNIFIALVSQLFMFYISTPGLFLYRVSAEPAMLVAGLLLSTFLTYIVYRPLKKTWIGAITLGFLVALAFAVKLIFLPLLILGLLWGTWRQLFIFLISFCISLRWITESIRGHYHAFFDWMWRLATRSGHYGTGEVGAPTFQQFVSRIVEYLYHNPQFLGILIVLIFVIIVAVKEKGTNWHHFNQVERILILFFGIALMNLIIFAKQPSERYMLPSLVILPGLAPLLWKWKPNQKTILYLLCISVFFAGVSGKIIYQKLVEIKAAMLDQQRYEYEIHDINNCKIIDYGLPKRVQFALHFGNGFAGSRYSEKLSILFPDFLYWHQGENKFLKYTGYLSEAELRDLKKEKCLVLTGPRLENPMEKVIYEGSSEGIYRASFNQGILKAPTLSTPN